LAPLNAECGAAIEFRIGEFWDYGIGEELRDYEI